MILDEKLFEAVQEGDIRGNYKKKALNKEKLYDRIIDKIQRELSKKGFKVGTDGDYLFVNKKIFKQPNKEGKIVIKSKFMLDKKDYNDLINYLDNIGIEHYFKDDAEGLRLILNINLENVDKIGLTEDIEKTKSGKWVNKGKEGTHGEFTTKKAARAQQKAMFASGWKGESLEERADRDSIKHGFEDFYDQFDIKPERKIKEVYAEIFPEEYQLDKIHPAKTIADIWSEMQAGEDVYRIASKDGEGFDSAVREGIFEIISKAFKIPYDTVYLTWRDGGDDYFEEAKEKVVVKKGEALDNNLNEST